MTLSMTNYLDQHEPKCKRQEDLACWHLLLLLLTPSSTVIQFLWMDGESIWRGAIEARHWRLGCRRRQRLSLFPADGQPLHSRHPCRASPCKAQQEATKVSQRMWSGGGGFFFISCWCPATTTTSTSRILKKTGRKPFKQIQALFGEALLQDEGLQDSVVSGRSTEEQQKESTEEQEEEEEPRHIENITVLMLLSLLFSHHTHTHTHPSTNQQHQQQQRSWPKMWSKTVHLSLGSTLTRPPNLYLFVIFCLKKETNWTIIKFLLSSSSPPYTPSTTTSDSGLCVGSR